MTKSNDDTRNRSTSIRDQLRGHTGRNDLTRPLCPYGARGERVAEFYEFFAGGGMVRAGLGPSWSCLFANDFDPKKAASYAANWGVGQLRIENIANITLMILLARPISLGRHFPVRTFPSRAPARASRVTGRGRSGLSGS
jgi:hypothetical protein